LRGSFIVKGLSAGSTTVTELVEALMKEEEDED
jgi:hypothetical protein